MLVLNTKDWEKIGQYSGNPFLDAMVDMQGVFSTVSTYYKHKPYIDKYSDTSLSDLKDKVKAYIPEAINQDGSINFSKLEELANQGNEMAEAIVGIRQARENFANASIGGKLETFIKPDLQPQLDILSGNILTKEAKVLRNQKEIEEAIKNSNLPEDVKKIMLLSKGALFKDPQTLAAFLPYLMLREQQPSNQQSSNQQTSDQQSNSDDNVIAFDTSFKAPQINSMQDIFPKAPQLNIDNTPKAVANKPTKGKKKYIKKKLSITNQPTIEQYIDKSFLPLNSINTILQTPPILSKQPTNNLSILDLFRSAVSNSHFVNFNKIGSIY
jgi:hypothetical protein